MNQVFTNFSKIGRILNLNLSKIDHIRKVGNTTQHEPDLNLRRTINIQLLTQVLRLDFGLMMYRFKSMHLSWSFTSRVICLFTKVSCLFTFCRNLSKTNAGVDVRMWPNAKNVTKFPAKFGTPNSADVCVLLQPLPFVRRMKSMTLGKNAGISLSPNFSIELYFVY